MPPLERACAGQHLIEHGAECEQVGAPVYGFAAHLLGCHVADRAHHHAWFGRQGRVRIAGVRRDRLLGEAEVEDLHVAVAREKDVLGFEVSMHEALVVR